MKYDQHIDAEAAMACEPALAYGAVERYATETEYLPADIVTAAAKYALREMREGRLIPADKALEAVHEDLGWK